MLKAEDIKVLKVFHEAMQWGKGGEVVLRCGAETGRVFFAGGKIAWAAISTIKRTFTDYLMEKSSVGREEIMEVFEDCKRTGKKLGETIVEWGLLDEATMRHLLLEHIGECLIEMFSWPAVDSMFIPEERNYKGSLTFSFVEVLEFVTKLDAGSRLPFGGTPVRQIMVELEKQFSLDAQSGGRSSFKDQELDWPPKRGKGKVVALVIAVVLIALGGLTFLFRDRLFPTADQTGATEAPATGTIKINSTPPDAEVYLDEVLQASRTPTQIENITAGEQHVLKVVAKNLPSWEKKFVIADVGKTIEFEAILSEGEKPKGEGMPEQPEEPQPPKAPSGIVAGEAEKGTGTFQVVSNPQKARIFLDGIYTGYNTPYTLKNVPAELDHVIIVEKKGRKPAFERFKLQNNQKSRISLTLRKKSKRQASGVLINVDSSPRGAGIYINGKRLKKTTPCKVKLRAEEASQLEVTSKGYQKWVRTVLPAPGVDLTFFAKLRKKK